MAAPARPRAGTFPQDAPARARPRACSYDELEDQLEELQLDHEEITNDLVDIQAEIRAAKIEAQELRMRLQTTERKNAPAAKVPDQMQTGAAGNPRAEELRRIFQWLADKAVLEEPRAFNANSDLIMGSQQVHLRNIVQWRLTGDLRLSVPEELAAEISNMLSAAKADGKFFSEAKATSIINEWVLTTSELLSETPTGVTLLTHSVSQRSCLVANFPPPPGPPPRQVETLDGVTVGDRVEVNFKEQWFTGTVKGIEESGVAAIHCDVDPPEVMLKASLHFLRKPSNNNSPPQEQAGIQAESPQQQEQEKNAFPDAGQASL